MNVVMVVEEGDRAGFEELCSRRRDGVFDRRGSLTQLSRCPVYMVGVVKP